MTAISSIDQSSQVDASLALGSDRPVDSVRGTTHLRSSSGDFHSCFPLFSKHPRILSPGSCFFCHCGVVLTSILPPPPSQPPDCHLDRESPRTTSARDAAAVKGQPQSQLFSSAGTCVRLRYHRDRATYLGSYCLFWPSPAGPVRTQLPLGSRHEHGRRDKYSPVWWLCC